MRNLENYIIRIVTLSNLLMGASLVIAQHNETFLAFDNLLLDSLIINGFSVHSGDVNSNGLKDFAVTQSDSAIGVYYLTPNGAYNRQFYSPDTGGIFKLMIADLFNLTAKQIVYSSSYSGLSALTILDDSTSYIESISPSIKWNFDVGDLNQDGLIDIVGNSDGRSTELVVVYQTSPGIFEENVLDSESGFGYGLRVIDYDRDDDLDIIASVVNGYDQLLFYENIGNDIFLKHVLLSNTPGILDFDIRQVDSLPYFDIYYVSNPFESTSTINRFRYGSTTNENQILATGLSQLWTISATNIDLDSDIELISGERNLASLFYLDFVDGIYENIQISDEIAFVTDVDIIQSPTGGQAGILYVAGNSPGQSSDVDTCAVGIVTIDEVYSDSTLLFYTFNDMQGDTVYDESQHGNNGVLHNVGQFDTFGQFSDSSYVLVNSDYYRLLDDELLIEILFSPSNTQQRASLISCFSGGGYEVFLENGSIHSKFVIGQDTLYINSAVDINENTWNHFAISLDENQIKIFINYHQIEVIHVGDQIRYGEASTLVLGQSATHGLNTGSQYYGLLGGIKISAISYGIENFINYDPSSTITPARLTTLAAYPNPFNPSTTIQYSLRERSEVILIIYDVLGRKIITLENGIKSKGDFKVAWNGLDQSGYALSTGVYLCRMRAKGYSKTIKLVYLK